MKQLLSIVLILISIHAKSQIQDSLSVLEGYLKEKNDSLLSAELKEFESIKRFNWLFFVPNVGYDAINNRASVSYSLSNIGNLLRSKEVRRQKRENLTYVSKSNHSNEVIRLKRKYAFCQFHVNSLTTDIEIFNIYLKLFEIEKGKYNNQEITIEQLLREEIAIKEKRSALNAQKEKILMLIYDIEILINKQINYSLPEY